MSVVVGTNLKGDAGKTEDGLCDWIKLKCVNVLLVPNGGAYLCEYSPVFNTLVQDPLCRSAHQWGVFL